MKKSNYLQSYLTRLRGLMLTLIILCSIGIGNAWGDTWTWTASGGGNLGTSNGSVTLNGKTWTVNRSSWTTSGTMNNGCYQCGSKNNPSTLTLSTSAFSTYTITQIDVVCSSYGGNHNIAMTVGASTFLAATATASGDGNSAANKSGSGSASGDITISFTKRNNSWRAMYIKSITITYSAAASCTTNPTVSAGSNSAVTSTTATVSCASGITSLGSAGCSISSYGFVIGSSSNPAIGGTGVTKHEVGTSYTTVNTSFSKNLTGLSESTTYYVRPYATNGNGTAYGTQTSFATPALPKYTVTYNAGTGTCGTASWTQPSYGASTTLPTATAPATCSGWSFAGWCTASAGSADDNTTSPGTILTSGSSYTPPTSDVTLYAVYTKTEGGGGGGATLTKMVAGNTLADGDKIVVVASGDYNSVAMYQETTNTSYVQKWDCSTLNTTTVSADDKNWWTVTATEGGFYLGDATNGYLNMSSNNLYCDNDQSVWTLADLDDGTFRLQSNSRNLSYRHDLTNAYWRMGGTSYGTSGQTILDIYKYSTGGGGGTTYYMTSLVCCTPLGTINGSVNFANPTKAVLVWDAVAHVDGWMAKWKTSAGSYATTNVSAVRDTLTNKKTCVVTGLNCNTNYDFKIIATPASGYCDKEQEITNQNSGQWDVTYSLSNASRSSGQTAGTDALCGDLDVVFAATPGYILPNSITVTGASSHTWNQETGALHVDAANITGDITVSFTATAATGWKFKSEADSWTEHAMTENAGVATCSVSLPADSRIEFCFDGNGTIYKNNGTIITTTTGWVFNTSDNNCKIHTGPAGTYTFAINTSTKAVTVTYPTVTHPNEHYVYFKNTSVWGTVKGYLGNTGNDNKAAAWPGSDMQATTSICGETYHYAALNAMSGTYNVIVFNNGSGAQTSDLSTTGSLGKYNANQDANWHDFTLYSITFAGNGSNGGSMTDVENICPNGSETLAANGYTRTGYTFANWKTNVAITANGSPVAANGDVPAGATISSINSNITLTAQWTANTISLTLDKNNNDASGSNNGSASILFDANAVKGSPAMVAATRTGYDIEGYYTDAGCTAANKVLDASGNVINSTVSGYTTSGKWTRATTPTTLYAKWTPTNYTVDWYVGGSAEGNKLTTGSQSTSVAYNNKVATLPTNPDGSPCDKVFVGWTDDTDYDHGTSLLFTDAAGSPAITGATNFYAVFATGGSSSYNLVESDLGTAWAGDYLIAYSSTVFADGRLNGTGSSAAGYGIGYNGNSVDPDDNLSANGKVVDATWGDTYNVTLEEIMDGDDPTNTYVLKTKDNYYNYITSNTNGIAYTQTKSTAANYPISITFNSASDIELRPGGAATGTVFSYNTADYGYFRFYKNGGQQDVYLYKKTGGYSDYTINCASCSNEVTVAYDADLTGGTVAVTKGGNTVAENGTVKTCTGNVDLTVTITPASHYTLTKFRAKIGSTTLAISPDTTVTLPKTVATTFTVTIPQNQTGTLVLTPTLEEDAHIAINWNVNGTNQSIAATHGLTWVYSGEDLTALPSTPSVPAGCSGTKVFAGWSQKHSDATEQNAAWYDDLFDAYDDPTVPTGITSAKTFYAVFATGAAGLGGTVIWDEPFDGDAGDQPSSPTSGATVYGSASIAYNCASTTYCKLYTDNLASGGAASPELLIPKSTRGEAFEITGIPTAGQTELTLTYMAKDALSVTTGTSGVTVGDASVNNKLYTRTITINQNGGGVATFDLTFEKSTDSNSRLDDIHLVVPGSSSMTDYLTLCAPSYTITYNKNTEDPVTNLPTPTSVLQSTGSGTLSSLVPTRYGYTFDGWATSAGGSVVYAAGAAVSSVSADMDLYAKWSVTPVTEINLSKTTLDKYVGDPSVTLSVLSVLPDGANTSVTWSSSNSSIATVNSSTGEVNFVAEGTANIIATSSITSGTTATCVVTVWAKPTATFLDNLHGLTVDENSVALSSYNLEAAAGTAVVFPTLANQIAGSGTCEDEHYIFVGWTTSDNNDDPEDHLVTSHTLANGDAITYYAVWADGVAGTTYVKLTDNSFSTSKHYVIGAVHPDNGATYYLNSCAKTDKDNSWGYVTADLASDTPIEFTLSGTASTLVATTTESTGRYLEPTTSNEFRMSSTSKTIKLNANGTIYSTDETRRLLLNKSQPGLRWYGTGTVSGTSNAYFYEVVAGGEVDYRTSCCADKVPAPTVTATQTSVSVTLNWNDLSGSGATGYEVSWNDGAWTSPSGTRTHSVSGLTPNTTYTWKVRATYTTPKCGADIASGSTTTNQVYHVTYAGGSGTGTCNATGSTTDATAYEAGATVTLQANGFTLVGHTFDAWTEDDEDITISSNQFTMPEHDVVITATWTPKVDKFYDRMHDGTDASHGGIADGDGKYYITREGCSYTVPSLTDNTSGATACHTKHYVLMGWTAESHLNSDGTLKTGHEGYVYTGGGTQTATGATYYAVWAEVTE